ncbi:Crp/Fnr family transcriptional regulator [Candidatus Binatus sp.]|uniref:Crp/Fnr family transcriptional regulator n=1 Tax=Candidatus Binatus sp. TaxID=2811406 RepID=UPI002F93BA79
MAIGAVCEEGYARLRGNFGRWRVPSAIIDDLVDYRNTVSYPRGAMVFLEGSPGDLFGCVLAGYVKVYCNTANGARVLARLSGPGDIIGYADSEDCKGRRSKIFETQALTKCSIALFTRERAVRLLHSLDPDQAIELYQTLNSFWSSTLHWWISFLGLPFQQRLEVVLGDLGRRVGVLDNRGTLIIPELSQADLAEMIASSRPLVSRLLNEMEQRGLVLRRGKQYILLKGGDSQEHRFARIQRPLGDEPRFAEAVAQQHNGRLSVVAERSRSARDKTTAKGAAWK